MQSRGTNDTLPHKPSHDTIAKECSPHVVYIHMFCDVVSVLFHNNSLSKEEPAEVEGGVISGNVHQLKKQEEPLDALRVKPLKVEFTFCPHFVECVKEVQTLKNEKVASGFMLQ